MNHYSMHESRRFNAAEREAEAMRSYADEALAYMRGRSAERMSVDRAITEVFRARNMMGMPEKTLDVLRGKIRVEIELRQKESAA